MTPDSPPLDYRQRHAAAPTDVNPALNRTRNTGLTYQRVVDALRRSEVGSFLPTMPRRLLDYGCGFGEGSSYLEGLFPGWTPDAYDSSPPAEWLHPKTTLLTPEELPVAPSYHLIFAISVLDGLSLSRRREVATDIYDLLLPGGVAVFVVRPWYHDIELLEGIRGSEPYTIYVPRGRNSTPPYVFQKGYTPLELEFYLQWLFNGNATLSAEVHALPIPNATTIASYIKKKGAHE